MDYLVQPSKDILAYVQENCIEPDCDRLGPVCICWSKEE